MFLNNNNGARDMCKTDDEAAHANSYSCLVALQLLYYGSFAKALCILHIYLPVYPHNTKFKEY